jgi:acyl-CoA synthetase (NDP forming)
VLFGNGGGTSVLASDAFARNGFAISAFDARTLAALAELHLPAGSSIANPIDVPASILHRENGAVGERILDVTHSAGTVHALVMHLNLPVILANRDVDLLGNLMKAALTVRSRHQGQTHFVLVLRSDGEPDIEARKRDYRHQAVALGNPVFDELAEAGKALAALAAYERYRLNHARIGPLHLSTNNQALLRHLKANCQHLSWGRNPGSSRLRQGTTHDLRSQVPL